jgi:hypothetical protein
MHTKFHKGWFRHLEVQISEVSFWNIMDDEMNHFIKATLYVESIFSESAFWTITIIRFSLLPRRRPLRLVFQVCSSQQHTEIPKISGLVAVYVCICLCLYTYIFMLSKLRIMHKLVFLK